MQSTAGCYPVQIFLPVYELVGAHKNKYFLQRKREIILVKTDSRCHICGKELAEAFVKHEMKLRKKG